MHAADPAFLRTRPTDRPVRGRSRSVPGFSLVEVMVAILLMSVIVVSTFSVALTAKRGVLKSERKVMAAYASKMLLDRLRNYVTASLEPQVPPMGPNGGLWSLPGDTNGSGYALSVGKHDAKDFLPQNLKDPPYSMKLTYEVTNIGGAGQADYRPQVAVKVEWDEGGDE